MYHLKLIKSLSYYSGVIKATAKKPDVYVTDKAVADKALNTGFFRLIEDKPTPKPKAEPKSEPEPEPQPEQETPDYDVLASKTKAELIKFANEKGISLEGCKTKAEILMEISHNFGGSYTMMELQQEE